MIKKLLFFGFSLFMLISCGTETEEVKKDPNYNYVEIEECTIPISNRYKKAKDGNDELYSHKYYDSNNSLGKFGKIVTQKRFQDDYIHSIEKMKKMKNVSLKNKRSREDFRILEFGFVQDTSSSYYLFGKKTLITLFDSDDFEVEYLINYCKKTWKLDKGEKNVI